MDVLLILSYIYLHLNFFSFFTICYNKSKHRRLELKDKICDLNSCCSRLVIFWSNTAAVLSANHEIFNVLQKMKAKQQIHYFFLRSLLNSCVYDICFIFNCFFHDCHLFWITICSHLHFLLVETLPTIMSNFD